MNPNQLLIPLLVLAHLTVAVVAVVSRGFIYPTNLFTYPLPICQVGLLALWAGLGKTPFWIRLPVLVAGAALWSWLLRRGEGIIQYQWFLVLSVEAALVLALLLFARLGGIRVEQLFADESTVQTENTRLRFSLRDLFVLVTAVCVCLGGMPVLVANWNEITFTQGDRPKLLSFSGAWAVLSFLALWLALGNRWSPVRIAIFFLLVATLAPISWLNLERPPHQGAAWLTAEHLLLTTASLFVLRICGYRLIARR